MFTHPKIKYFVKSMKINRPLTLKTHNLIDLQTLRQLSWACPKLLHGQAYKAVFLTGFLFHDLFFTKNYAELLIKWSKTFQTRDKVKRVTLPKLKNSSICPFAALKALFHP